MYFNRETGRRLIVHVDDLLAVGPPEDRIGLKRDLQLEYEVDGDTLGSGPGCVSETRLLGRYITSINKGLEWESDPK